MRLQEHHLRTPTALGVEHHQGVTAIGAGPQNIGQINAGGTQNILRTNAPGVRKRECYSITPRINADSVTSHHGSRLQQRKETNVKKRLKKPIETRQQSQKTSKSSSR